MKTLILSIILIGTNANAGEPLKPLEYINFLKNKSVALQRYKNSYPTIFAKILETELAIETQEEAAVIEQGLTPVFNEMLVTLKEIMVEDPHTRDMVLKFLIAYTAAEYIPHDILVIPLTFPAMEMLNILGFDKSLDLEFRKNAIRALNSINGEVLIHIDNVN